MKPLKLRIQVIVDGDGHALHGFAPVEMCDIIMAPRALFTAVSRIDGRLAQRSVNVASHISIEFLAGKAAHSTLAVPRNAES